MSSQCIQNLYRVDTGRYSPYIQSTRSLNVLTLTNPFYKTKYSIRFRNDKVDMPVKANIFRNDQSKVTEFSHQL